MRDVGCRARTQRTVLVAVVVVVIERNDGYFCCCFSNVMLLVLFLSPQCESCFLQRFMNSVFRIACMVRSQRTHVHRTSTTDFHSEQNMQTSKIYHWQCHSQTSFIYLPTTAHSNTHNTFEWSDAYSTEFSRSADKIRFSFELKIFII